MRISIDDVHPYDDIVTLSLNNIAKSARRAAIWVRASSERMTLSYARVSVYL